MTPEQIVAACAEGRVLVVEDVDPSTATLERGFVVVSGRAALPLSSASWARDRSDDWPITDEVGTVLGTLCLLSSRPPMRIAEMTSWQFTAFLADCGLDAVSVETHQFSRDYAVIDQGELDRYITRYLQGSALWGGYSHAVLPPEYPGWRQEIRARPDVVAPTGYHEAAFTLATRATGPREQFLKLYHTIELLFDFVTFRKLLSVGNDLVGFGKVMAAYQRSELDKLKAIIREFCLDLDALVALLPALLPYLDRAEEMFQAHSKDGNPLAGEGRWSKFRDLVEAGTLDPEALKRASLAPNAKGREDLIIGLTAYFIYRIRSSVAHNRIGEYVLTSADDEFIGRFGVVLVEEVALQTFGSARMAELTLEPI